MNKFGIPSDKELEKQLLKIQENSNWKVPEELHGIDWFSFLEEKENEENKVL